LNYDVGGEVHAGHCAGVVVDDERNGGLVCDAGEELKNAGGGRREERCIVGGWEDESVVSTCCVGFAAVLDGFADGLGAASYEDGEVREAGSREC